MHWRKKQKIKKQIKKAFGRSLCAVILILIFAANQALLLDAYEAHVINVTSKICDYSETRTIGYWKNHSDIFVSYLPQNLGNEAISTVAQALTVFNNATAADMRNMLKGQLLAMKFNIAHFSIGSYPVEGENMTLDELTAYADQLLIDPNSTREEMERIKNILNTINNLHRIKYCRVPGTGGPEPDHIVINEIYYDVDSRLDCQAKETDPDNEWVEIYNPTDEPIDISGWTLSDNNATSTIPSSPLIPAQGFAVVSATSTTWNFWQIPDQAIKISLNHKIGNGLANTGDHLVLKDAQGVVIDQMSYETDHYVWNPAPPLDINNLPYNLPKGHSLGRLPDGFDTDVANDFDDIELPTPGHSLNNPRVRVSVPNGGEMWYMNATYHLKWLATNPIGNDSDLNIDIWYSVDSGKNWIYQIADNAPNTGDYKWKIPINNILASSKARIKVIATNPDSLMGWDMSDCDFCPPIADDEEVILESVDFIVTNPISTDAASPAVETAPELIVINIESGATSTDVVIDQTATMTSEIIEATATSTPEIIESKSGAQVLSETITDETQPADSTELSGEVLIINPDDGTIIASESDTAAQTESDDLADSALEVNILAPEDSFDSETAVSDTAQTETTPADNIDQNNQTASDNNDTPVDQSTVIAPSVEIVIPEPPAPIEAPPAA